MRLFFEIFEFLSTFFGKIEILNFFKQFFFDKSFRKFVKHTLIMSASIKKKSRSMPEEAQQKTLGGK